MTGMPALCRQKYLPTWRKLALLLNFRTADDSMTVFFTINSISVDDQSCITHKNTEKISKTADMLTGYSQKPQLLEFTAYDSKNMPRHSNKLLSAFYY